MDDFEERLRRLRTRTPESLDRRIEQALAAPGRSAPRRVRFGWAAAAALAAGVAGFAGGFAARGGGAAASAAPAAALPPARLEVMLVSANAPSPFDFSGPGTNGVRPEWSQIRAEGER
jgi:hypothetical protein